MVEWNEGVVGLLVLVCNVDGFLIQVIYFVCIVFQINFMFSQMVDQKVSILMGVIFVVFIILVGQVSCDYFLVLFMVFVLFVCILVLFVVLVIIFWVGVFVGVGMLFNLLFFGVFIWLSEDEFVECLLCEL